jgi:hypothetical protein
MQRCLPSFKKEINGNARMVVGVLEDEEWAEFSRRKMFGLPGRCSCRKVTFPTPQFLAQDDVTTLQWRGSNLPPLHHAARWGKLKWILEGTSILMRASIADFALVRNGWTGIVRVHFTYRTETYDWPTGKWREI